MSRQLYSICGLKFYLCLISNSSGYTTDNVVSHAISYTIYDTTVDIQSSAVGIGLRV